MVDATFFGLAAGLFQLAGYIAYYLLVIRKEGKEAEPLTWFMFAYGTALLTVMELDTMLNEAAKDSSWLNIASVLLLPLICSLGGIGVAIGIWRQNFRETKLLWPKGSVEGGLVRYRRQGICRRHWNHHLLLLTLALHIFRYCYRRSTQLVGRRFLGRLKPNYVPELCPDSQTSLVSS